MIAVDSQMFVYLLLKTPFKAVAERVRERDPIWVAPPLWRSEFRSVLAGAIRRGEVSLGSAMVFFDTAAGLLSSEPSPHPGHILSLVETSPCTAYDLEFVAVAQSLGIKLVTNDKEVLAAFPETAVSPANFVS